ncbi:hypothetical protein BT96DRAFT_998538 [Gymnopus androsaceus JB14]|uniref:Uncharacterized protein n=1 Tax=Gymnopus androsaceus JB14 TaxID=1447944 RepID=A0A6A4HAT8_9AGAR|nr:hypothetical protein BT96DRAFT_998538 [Gymnopus androsaceus JB14]
MAPAMIPIDNMTNHQMKRQFNHFQLIYTALADSLAISQSTYKDNLQSCMEIGIEIVKTSPTWLGFTPTLFAPLIAVTYVLHECCQGKLNPQATAIEHQMIVDNNMKSVQGNTVNAPSKCKSNGPAPKANSKCPKSTATVAKAYLDNNEPLETSPFAQASHVPSPNLIILDDDDAIMAGPLDPVNATIDPDLAAIANTMNLEHDNSNRPQVRYLSFSDIPCMSTDSSAYIKAVQKVKTSDAFCEYRKINHHAHNFLDKSACVTFDWCHRYSAEHVAAASAVIKNAKLDAYSYCTSNNATTSTNTQMALSIRAEDIQGHLSAKTFKLGVLLRNIKECQAELRSVMEKLHTKSFSISTD